MTRHGMVERSAAGVQPPATDPGASMVIIDAERAASDCARSLQGRAARQRSCPSASNPTLPGCGRATADISRNPKSP
ncbi:hypothetical protein FJW08_08005 [Mesorhizobium sp. B3-2-1]|nr:hypothetical protein FJW08_08005 [Mesorhizobium sp. B3-2-1]